MVHRLRLFACCLQQLASFALHLLYQHRRPDVGKTNMVAQSVAVSTPNPLNVIVVLG